MQFFVGLHQPSDARHFARCMVSVNRLARRRSGFVAGYVMLDSGAFTKVARDGGYTEPPEVYAAQVVRWSRLVQLVAACSEDYMCEPFVLRKTGLSIEAHQRLTVERYDALRALVGDAAYLMPVIQGYLPQHYAQHVRDYGERLAPGAWVGVGSVCKRNGSPRDMAAVLRAVKSERPDLRLHLFGAKLTALQSHEIRAMAYSADSMAWSFRARRQGRDANDWREAERFVREIGSIPARAVPQGQLSLWEAA